MSHASLHRHHVEAIPLLLKGAKALGDPYGAVIELCVRAACQPWEAIEIYMSEIDWCNGRVPVPARGGGRRLLHLPYEAKRTIVRVAGLTAASGQAVTGRRGRPLDRHDVRIDLLADRLAAAAPETAPFGPLIFNRVRAATARELIRHGSSTDDVCRALAITITRSGGVMSSFGGGSSTTEKEAYRAGLVLEKWNAILAGIGCAE